MAVRPGSLMGKVCLVTGATGGIGLVTARELARGGAVVVGVGRSPERAKAAAAQLRQQTGNAAVEYLVADLSAQAEIRRLAEAFRQRYDRLDVLVNNAGAMFLRREETVDGLERTFALNHLAYFLLTHRLLPVLRASAPARIVNVASAAHVGARLDFDDLQSRRGYRGFRAYGRSKLANVLFTYELARRLAGTGVTANALHPGFVGTGFGQQTAGRLAPLWRVVQLFALSPEHGAQTSIYLAGSPAVEGVTGQYFVKQQPVRSSPASYDEAVARHLWEVSLQLTGETDEEITSESTLPLPPGQSPPASP
jgi:NAD(P)-dependent dehydrogenase (short-subunit alcohol dehydrogenase family)